MRDKTHMDFIERWACFVRANPGWKTFHTKFVNAQYRKCRGFIQRLVRQKGGASKLINLYNIKNLRGYKKLLRL